MELSIDQDRELRTYARRISPNDGEDAYHTAICEVLERGGWEERIVMRPTAYFRTATKLAFYKICRSARAERENVASWLAGDPPPSSSGLKAGRLPHSHCRRGHALTDDNLIYVGPRRTCKACFLPRKAAAARKYRQRKKELAHA